VDPGCGGYYFNDEAIRILRRIEYLRNVCGINLSGIKMILDLVNEAERLRAEVRFLRR
jgi:DNA-binding transcriptional MerR regulator